MNFLDYIIFGFVDNGIMLFGAIFGYRIEHKLPKRWQTGFMGATIGAGVGNTFSDLLAGFGASNILLGIGSAIGCLIALAGVPLYVKFKSKKENKWNL